MIKALTLELCHPKEIQRLVRAVPFSTRLREFPVFLFSPLLVYYCLGYLFHSTPREIAPFFDWWLLLALGFGINCLVRCVVTVKVRAIPILIFWLGLLYLLWWPRAYLEFPSDPWEHWSRIVSWSTTRWISDSDNWFKFAYFWEWTFTRNLSISQSRDMLSVLSAFNQWLLAFHVFQFARRLGFQNGWDYLAVVGFFAFFGHSLFGIRYYALSSTPMAYCAYLASMCIVLDVINKRDTLSNAFIPLLVCLIFMALNHTQCLIFLSISLAAIYLAQKVEKLVPSERARLFFPLFCILFCSYLFSILILWLAPKFFTSPAYHREHLTLLGTFRLGGHPFNLLETLGIHGVLALLFAVADRKRSRSLCYLTVLPILTLFIPFSVWLMVKTFSFGSHYRVLYAMPTSFALLSGLRHRLPFRPAMKLLVSAVITILLGLGYGYPFRGRLFFQFYQSPEARELVALDSTAEWFKNNHLLDRNCYLLTDGITQFMLNMHLDRKQLRADRTPPVTAFQILDTPFGVIDFVQMMTESEKIYGPICGVLYIPEALLPKESTSLIARSSQHWQESWGDFRSVSNRRLESWIPWLVENHGWTVREVPPFYLLAEPSKNPPFCKPHPNYTYTDRACHWATYPD